MTLNSAARNPNSEATDDSPLLEKPNEENTGHNKFEGRHLDCTVSDILVKGKPPKLVLIYHVLAAGWDVFNPLGTVVGGVLGLTGLVKSRPLISAAKGGLFGGGVGMAVGLLGLYAQSRKGADAKPVPWTKEGIQDRVDRLAINFPVRMLDLGSWNGLAFGGLASAAFGPIRLGFGAGAFGVLQAMSFWSAVGSLSSVICMAQLKPIKGAQNAAME